MTKKKIKQQQQQQQQQKQKQQQASHLTQRNINTFSSHQEPEQKQEITGKSVLVGTSDQKVVGSQFSFVDEDDATVFTFNLIPN